MLAKVLLKAVVSHPDRSVLCITFTENGAAEMQKRVEKTLSRSKKTLSRSKKTLSRSKKTLPRSTGKPAVRRICTLHSYCWQKLWKEAADEGVRLHVIDDGYLKDFSDTSGLDAFNQANNYENKENDEIRLEQVVRAASCIRQGKEVHFEPWRKDAWQGKFREFTDKYIAFKEELNQPDGRNRYVDFNDILMEADGRIREGVWTERFDIVLVDEVQDLSSAQRSHASEQSLVDVTESFRLGMSAHMRSADKAFTGKMVGVKRREGEAYEVDYFAIDADQVANFVKGFPKEWILPEYAGITDEAYAYLRPLIQGSPVLIYEDGLPAYVEPYYMR